MEKNKEKKIYEKIYDDRNNLNSKYKKQMVIEDLGIKVKIQN